MLWIQLLQKNIIFPHAMSCCDTKSAVFMQEKKKLLKTLVKNLHLDGTVKVFNELNANWKIVSAG